LTKKLLTALGVLSALLVGAFLLGSLRWHSLRQAGPPLLEGPALLSVSPATNWEDHAPPSRGITPLGSRVLGGGQDRDGDPARGDPVAAGSPISPAPATASDERQSLASFQSVTYVLDINDLRSPGAKRLTRTDAEARMTRGDLHTSAVFAFVIGAVLVWFGTKMFRRPVETTQQLMYFVRRDRPAPKWARPHPDPVRSAARQIGATLIALGLGLLVLGAYEARHS
jgi:hypothetical protein